MSSHTNLLLYVKYIKMVDFEFFALSYKKLFCKYKTKYFINDCFSAHFEESFKPYNVKIRWSDQISFFEVIVRSTQFFNRYKIWGGQKQKEASDKISKTGLFSYLDS